MCRWCVMDIDSRIKLKRWLERKYYTRSSVDEGNASVVIKSDILESEGIDIHTDGIVEKNEKDFDMCIVSGYNYIIICKFGSEYKDSDEPRIIVHCNRSSIWKYHKFKSTIKSILRKYQ